MIDFFLQSSSNTYPFWSCDAQAKIRLLPFVGENRTLEWKLPKRTYKTTIPSNEVRALVSWDDFVKYYVKDNETQLEIELSTNRATFSLPSGVNQKIGRVQMLLNNVSELKDFNSTKVIAQGVTWKIHVQRKDYYLAAFLEAEEDNFNAGSNYNVSATFKLLSFDISHKPLIKNFTHNYRWGSFQEGFEQYLHWDDFFSANNKYVVKDKAHLLVQFTVEDPESLWEVYRDTSRNSTVRIL